jgi:serine/threonine protein kinase
MLIGGRYQVEEKLGSGGMGTVYRGVDTQTQQIVAIKQLDRQAIEMDASILERFNREGEALRELNHPNIVKILDTLEENNEHYLVIEYIAGGDLAHMLEAGPLSVRRAVELALDLTDALTRAHRLNIIHRDIKPANVLLTPNGQPRLTDFGIAHIGDKENLTRSGMMVGTIRYLPPEALSDRPVDARSDIWAFGVMLYEMLTGKHPFDGETSSSIMLNIIQQPHPDITDYRKDLPAALVNLINRMIEKDPDKRIPSVRLVGAELEKVLQLLDDPTSSTNLSDSFIQRLARHERQIFISYSSKDRSRVSGIVKQLQGMGYLVWYDQELTGGQEWWDQILTQIRNCDLFLFMVTPRSMASYPCQLERDYARALNKLIMPLVLEPVDILGDIATIQLVNYLEGDEAEVAVLKNALEKVPEGAPLPNPLPPAQAPPYGQWTKFLRRSTANRCLYTPKS